MNNNNLYNTNNFIGTTHNDYFKTASNALSKAINSLELNSSNYTSNVSNILNTNSSNYTSNVNINSSNYIQNTSNAILARYDPMIETITETVSVNTPLLMNPMPLNLYHTYIYNSNVIGEIRFWCKSTQIFPIPISLGVPDYRVKIDVDGKLKVYYTYDPFISLTIGNSWIDVHTTLISLVASDINIGITLAGLEAQIQNNFATVQEQFAGLFCNLFEDDIINNNMRNRLEEDTAAILASSTVTTTTGTLEQLYIYMSSFYRTQRLSRLTQAVNLINLRISQNAAAAFFLGIGGVALSFIYGISQAESHNDYISTVLNGAISSNLNFTEPQKRVLYDSNNLSIISNYIDQLEYTSNITALQGFINTNIQDIQYIPNLSTSNLYINTGNLNKLVASSSISENGVLISNKYLTSNHLYNLSYNYSSERQYPSKLYSSIQSEDIVSLLGKLVYRNILFLDNSSILYGSGFYEIYSSSTYDTLTTKNKLFNFDIAETTNTPRWAIAQYNSGTGNYVADNSIDGSYYGDWVIIKMPNQILLTRYRIYRNTLFTERAPAEWKVYGSNDGITFTEITEASQMTRLLSLNYTNNYYDKTLASTFTTQYQYFGFVFNKLLSTSGETSLNFAELQIFGKEIISNSITSNIYATSNAVKSIVQYDMPNVCKHYGVYCSIQTAISINSITYYKYDLDLRNYLKKGTIQLGAQTGDTYYTFKLSMFYASNYFDLITAGLPNVCSYEVYQAYKQNGINLGILYQGLNCCAVGFPPNPLLQNTPTTDFGIMRNGAGNIDYITLIAKQSCIVRVVLEDRVG